MCCLCCPCTGASIRDCFHTGLLSYEIASIQDCGHTGLLPYDGDDARGIQIELVVTLDSDGDEVLTQRELISADKIELNRERDRANGVSRLTLLLLSNSDDDDTRVNLTLDSDTIRDWPRNR